LPPRSCFENVCLSRGGNLILDDICATAPAGGSTVIVGPNGAGKTTLLLCLIGELAYTGGHPVCWRETATAHGLCAAAFEHGPQPAPARERIYGVKLPASAIVVGPAPLCTGRRAQAFANGQGRASRAEPHGRPLGRRVAAGAGWRPRWGVILSCWCLMNRRQALTYAEKGCFGKCLMQPAASAVLRRLWSATTCRWWRTMPPMSSVSTRPCAPWAHPAATLISSTLMELFGVPIHLYPDQCDPEDPGCPAVRRCKRSRGAAAQLFGHRATPGPPVRPPAAVCKTPSQGDPSA